MSTSMIPFDPTPLWSCKVGGTVTLDDVRNYLRGDPPKQGLRMHRVENGLCHVAEFTRQPDDTFRRVR